MTILSNEQRILIEIWKGNHVFYMLHLSSAENKVLNSTLSYSMYERYEANVLNGIRMKWMAYKDIKE
jgi:hypothetical protein